MMSELLRKVSALSMAGLMASGVAFASTSENVQTGANSDNDNDVDIDQDLDTDVDNTANISNVGTATASTGGNDANENTDGGDNDTGEATIDADLENLVNTLEAYFSGNFGDVDWDLLNKITGSNSDNDNDIDVDQDIDFDVDNYATLENILTFLAQTGGNDANQNTDGGDNETGDATAWADIMNELNFGGGSDDGVEFGDVNVSMTNQKTGADSDNDNDIDVDQDVDVDVNNTANVTNVVTSTARTGGNDANQNTSGGTNDTGDAKAGATIENKINQGSGYGDVEFSDVDADLSNDTTGFNSNNDNDLDVDQDVDVNVNNDATVNNVVNETAQTGGNDANQNTAGGDNDTGDAEVTIDISNTVN